MRTSLRILTCVTLFGFALGCSSPQKSREKSAWRTEIETEVQKYADDFRVCHNRGKNQSALGEIRVVFKLDQTGKVIATGVEKTTLNDSVVEDCVLGVFEKIQFAPQKTKTIDVTYPLVFN